MKEQFSQFRITTLIVLVAIFFVSSLSAQIVDNKAKEIGKTAKRKTERKVDKAVDNVIDDGLDAIFNKKKNKKKKDDEWEDDWEDTDETTEQTEEYVDDSDIIANDFIGSFSLETKTLINGEISPDESGTTHYSFDRNKTAVQPLNQPGSPTLIYDLEKRTLTTVQAQNGNKTAVVIKRPDAKIEKINSKDIKITPLTVTRTINGYSCKKYVIDKPDEIVTMWVAEELYYNFRKLMLSGQAQNRNAGELAGDHFKDIYGFPVKITVEGKSEDRITEMQLTNINSGNTESDIFDLSGAQVTDMTKY
ncbi:MAG: hypothetical protein ACI85O_000352 [Saprospiraceae bacterium]|jgi:hypothetical protein